MRSEKCVHNLLIEWFKVLDIFKDYFVNVCVWMNFYECKIIDNWISNVVIWTIANLLHLFFVANQWWFDGIANLHFLDPPKYETNEIALNI